MHTQLYEKAKKRLGIIQSLIDLQECRSSVQEAILDSLVHDMKRGVQSANSAAKELEKLILKSWK